MITDQKNYVHAYMNDIRDKESSYISIINQHHSELLNLIKNTGNESTAAKLQTILSKNRQAENIAEKKIAEFLKKNKNTQIYNNFLEALLEGFSDISVDKDNLLTDNLTINTKAITSVSTKVQKVRKAEYHLLKTLDSVIQDAFYGIIELKKQNAKKKNLKMQSIIDELTIHYRFVRSVYNTLKIQNVGSTKHLNLNNFNLTGLNPFDANGNQKTANILLEESLNFLHKHIQEAKVITNLRARLREIVITTILNAAEDIANNNITNAIQEGLKRDAGNKTVTFSFDPKVTGKLFKKEAQKNTKDRIAKKVGNNDFYIDFGVDKVQNKIDGYVAIGDQNIGLSIKSYNLKSTKSKHITLTNTLNLLSLILGMENIEKSYAFLNIIAPQGKSSYRKRALDILKWQAVYAAATGHLGGRTLLGEDKSKGITGDKAQYLIVEDKTSTNVYVYPMSTLLLDTHKYINIDPNPFTLVEFRKYFVNDFISNDKKTGSNIMAAMKRNTILYLKLRQSKIDISVKASALGNGTIQAVTG